MKLPNRITQLSSSVPPELTTWRHRIRALRQVARRTGLTLNPTPRGLLELARMRAAGPLGLASLVRFHAANTPDRIAFLGQPAVTWRQLDDVVDRLASGLERDHGVGRGDSVLLAMHNRAALLETQAAVARLGASAVSASWRSTPDELTYLIGDSGARTVICDSTLLEAMRQVSAPPSGAVSPSDIVVVDGGAPPFTDYDALVRRSPRRRRDGEPGRVVIYTSGTTGKPKGAVRGFEEDMLWGLVHTLRELPLRADDRHLVVCPLYHSTAFGFASLSMLLGASVLIEARFDPERFLDAVARYQITTTAVVPTMLHRLLDLPERVRRGYDTRSLRAIFTGGAPLSGTLARRSIEEFGHVLYNFYGATETGINTVATPEELLRAPGTIGHAVGENELLILDEQGRECGAGETGELWVRNAMLVEGYHGNEEATRAAMRDGYFSVGDLAHRDADGLFFIDGRQRDMIISGGVNIYPAEIEEVLHRHPEVAEVAVVGVNDEEWGERVRAFVVPRDGFDTADFIGWARQRLAGPKLPRDVRILEALPKNPTGKVLKRELRARP